MPERDRHGAPEVAAGRCAVAVPLPHPLVGGPQRGGHVPAVRVQVLGGQVIVPQRPPGSRLVCRPGQCPASHRWLARTSTRYCSARPFMRLRPSTMCVAGRSRR
ncbi:hypothetical protein [Streptomyces echinatus]|uniref:hypothetical protein n=1 Tax=Streptomyces echinatus TaxID=67293 RepID=UPI00378EE61D